MKKGIIVLGFIFITFITYTIIINNKELDLSYLIGNYSFQKMEYDIASFDAEKWKEMTGIEHFLTINKDKIATITSKSIVDGKELNYDINYTIDDKFFYSTKEEKEKVYSYEYANGIFKLMDIDQKNYSAEIYKKDN